MNTAKSFKISLRVALVGILLCALYHIACHFAMGDFYWAHRTFMEVSFRCFAFIKLLSIIVACVSVFVHRKHLPAPDKQLRVLSHVAAWTMMLLVILDVIKSFEYFGLPFFFVGWWPFAVIILLSAGFLWKYSSLPLGEDSLPKPFSAAILFMAIFATTVLLIMCVGGCYALCIGHVYRFGFGSKIYFSWVLVLVPAILFPCYAIHISTDKKLTSVRNKTRLALLWIGFIAMLCVFVMHFMELFLY